MATLSNGEQLSRVDNYLQLNLNEFDARKWDNVSNQYFKNDEGEGWTKVEQNDPKKVSDCLDEAKFFLNKLNVKFEDALKF